MKLKKSTKSSSSLTDKLIDIASSGSERSENESDTEILSLNLSHQKFRMPNDKANSEQEQIDNLPSKVSDNFGSKQSSLTAQIEIDQVQVYHQSKWSNSGGSVLGLLTTSTENDYSLWLRLKQKQRAQEGSTTFFGSTILSLFSGGSREKYSFDKVLVADDIPTSNPSPISRPYYPSQDNHANKECLIQKKSSKPKKKDQSFKENSLKNHQNSVNMKSNELLLNDGETEKLMLNNGALCATTNINLNDDDDDEEFLGKKKANEGCCNWSLYKGIFYALLSSLFFSLSCVIVKFLKVNFFNSFMFFSYFFLTNSSQNIHPGQLAVARYVGVLTLSIPLVVYHRQSPFGPPEMRHLLVLRGLSGATSLFLRFYAFRYLPIADASVIVFAIPIFVSIFGHFFLNVNFMNIFLISLSC